MMRVMNVPPPSQSSGHGCSRGTRASGFSLAELVITIGILSTSIIMVAGVFTYLFNASQKSVDTTAGAIAARAFLQQWTLQLASNIDPATKMPRALGAYSGQTSEQLYDTSRTTTLNGTSFNYQLYVQDVTTALMPTATGRTLMKLRVHCWWFDGGGNTPGIKRSEYGAVSVDLVRLMSNGDF